MANARATAPPDGETPAAAFFRAAAACFATASSRHAAGDQWLRIARRPVRIRFAGNHLRAVIAPAFAHLQSAAQQIADLTILLWDTATTGVVPPPIPWRPNDRDRAGKIRGFCDARFTTMHEPDTGQLWMLDRQSATAVVWMNDVDAVPLWDRVHPLRKPLHAWARGFGADLLHAGAVGIDGMGVLVVGPGGTGKSTTVLAAMDAGMAAVGDDYVLIDAGSTPRSPAGSPSASPPGSPPIAHALYGTMRLHQAHLDRFPTLMIHHDHVFQEPWSGRAKVTSYISRHLPDRLTSELLLIGMVIPKVVVPQVIAPQMVVSQTAASTVIGPQAAKPQLLGQRLLGPQLPGNEPSELTRETPARALLSLAPSSVLQVDPTDTAMFARLAHLCRLLPCWCLPLGSDLTQVADQLTRLIRAHM